MEPNKPNIKLEEPAPEPEQEPYVPRPKWQIAMAWIGVAIMIIGIILYYYHIIARN